MRLAALGVDDAGELLTLQRAAFVSEAQLVGDARIAPLTQTLGSLREELTDSTALGLRDGPRLVAAVRWRIEGDVARIGRLVVAPDRQGEGLGSRMLRAAEERIAAGTCELFTAAESRGNLRLYARHGYTEVRRTAGPPSLVVLRKVRGR